MPEIGTKVSASLPTFVVGQPEAESWRLQDLFNRLIKQYLEDTTLQNAIAALQASITTLTGQVAGNLNAQIVDSLGQSAVTDVGGIPMLRTLDQRTADLLHRLGRRLEKKLEDIYRRERADVRRQFRRGTRGMPRGVSASSAAVVLAWPDNNRTAISIQNLADTALYVAVGSWAVGNALGQFGVKLAPANGSTPGGYLEPPPPGNTAVIVGIWDAGFTLGGAAIQEYSR